MNNLPEPNPKPTELSSQAGQAKPVTNEPTTQEMEIWNKECNLSIGTSSDLADLANKTKKSKHCLSYHRCSSDSQLIML